jgi:multicomponent Na+:H+ antiporter subunit B
MVVMIAFAVGIERTAAWLDLRALAALVAAGPFAFGVVALLGIAFGGAFLQFDVLPIPKASVYATEVVEIGIGGTVAAAIVVLFVRIAATYEEPAADDASDEPAQPRARTDGDRR